MKITRLAAVFDHIIDYMTVFAGVLLVFMLLIINAEIIFRYFLHSPLGWTVEISTFILLYITFLVAAWVLKTEGHVSIDIALAAFNPRTQSLINMVTSAICVVVCLILTWYSSKVTIDLYNANYFTPTWLQAPKFVIIGIIAVGNFMLIIQFLRRTYSYLNKRKTSADKKLPTPEKVDLI